ncbi:Aph-1 protein [Dictyocaulus viviparus]|uniref:Aph-1 protein n=1 Tax=Dictyocaulus viviparus TaxID=29172 RepID=A0A0D8YAD6_DICVI|nr:Aph-1 protein [Dictyocaulus viviparus]
MGVWLTVACYLITFSPSAALFCRFVAKDPLRIILFVLGAFFWLASLLICAFIWLAISMVWDALPLTVLFSIILQDAARILYFWLLKKAQRGLNKITRPGATSIAPGVTDLHNARHMLAMVCGLGMGVMAALVLTMNVFAEFSGPGTIGLPRAMKMNTRDIQSAGTQLPLYYALSGCLSCLFNVTWTIMVSYTELYPYFHSDIRLQLWDSCHKVKQGQFWALPGITATSVHVIVSVASWYNSYGYQPIVLCVQFTLLLGCILYSQVIMGATLNSVVEGEFLFQCKFVLNLY